MQAFECLGLWFLPDTDAPPVAGTLRVSSSGGLRLSLIGSLCYSNAFNQAKEHSIILGSVDGPLGNDITLTSCYLTRSQFGSFVDAREEYRAQRGFFRAHLRTPSEFAFRRVQLQVGGLGAWAHSLSGFQQGGLGGRRVGELAPLLSYATPAPVGGPISGGEISLGFGLTSSSTQLTYTHTERPGLVVTCDTHVSETEINTRLIYPLQNLMTFVCDRAQEVEQVSLWRDDILISRSENPEIRLIGERVFPEVEDEKTEAIHPHELLFTLAEIDGGFANFVEKWLRLTTTYAESCNIFFGLQYRPPTYLDWTFLGIIEALCLYYTRRGDGVAHRIREQLRLGEILGKLSSEDSEWIQAHIWARPFPPLHDILTKLLSEHSEVMRPLLRTGEVGLISQVVNTVNFTIRQDPDVGLIASHGSELYWLMVKLRILLKLCFLRELEFSVEKCRSFFARNGVYQHLCQLVAAERAAS